MGDYLSRKEILSKVITEDLEFRGGKILVKELDAETAKTFFDEGIITYEETEEVDEEGNPVTDVKVDASRYNFNRIASASIVEPDTLDPLFTLDETRKLPFGLVSSAAQKALTITDWGTEKVEEVKKE